MRTTKLNVVSLDPGEQIEVRCGNTALRLAAIDDGDYSTIEVIVPSGTSLSGVARLEPNGLISNELLSFSDEDCLREQVSGPVRMIAFVDSETAKLEKLPTL